jgi:hypothetical protein
MPTKAGAVQTKDLVQGKIYWIVEVSTYVDRRTIAPPERIFVQSKARWNCSKAQPWHLKWKFLSIAWSLDNFSDDTNKGNGLFISGYGMHDPLHISNHLDTSRFFTTLRHAQKYILDLEKPEAPLRRIFSKANKRFKRYSK